MIMIEMGQENAARWADRLLDVYTAAYDRALERLAAMEPQPDGDTGRVTAAMAHANDKQLAAGLAMEVVRCAVYLNAGHTLNLDLASLTHAAYVDAHTERAPTERS